MAKKKYDSSEGVWRTIGGRRVFIRKGQSLSDAMKESGKFKKKDEEEKSKKMNETMDRRVSIIKKLDDDTKDLSSYDKYNLAVSKLENNDYSSPTERQYWEGEIERYKKSQSNRKLSDVDKEWTDLAKKMENDYDEFGTTNWQDEKRLNELSLERDTLSIKDDKFYTRKDGTKEYDPYKGTRFEKKYDSVEDALNDPNHPTRKYIDEKLNWREQVKRNNELMEKELEDYKKNHDISRESDGYYEIFRNNERRNAKIKQEVPTEPYEYVEAYAGYHDKSYKLAGTKMSGKDVVEYGRNSWTGKEYTNDEFMEHLTDSNWHQERKMLEEAKLTNEELSYIKDHTTLSQWSVGEELTGSKNTQKMIDEAKDYSKYAKKIREKQNTPYYKQQMDKAVSELQSSTLENKYKGTVDYLKQTTNMSGAEILELLKRIDEDKR